MILLYYRDLRRRIQRLEAQRLPKPKFTYYLEAVDENGDPWNIVGPDYYWLRDENDPGDKPPSMPEPGGPPVYQAPLDPENPVDAPPQLAHDHPAANLPSFGHNQAPADRSRSRPAPGGTTKAPDQPPAPG